MRHNDKLPVTHYKLLPIFWFQERVSSEYLVSISSPVGMQVTNVPDNARLSIVKLTMLLSQPIKHGYITTEIWTNELYTGYAKALESGSGLTVVWDIPFDKLHVRKQDKIGVAVASSPGLQPTVTLDLIMYATTGVG